MWVHLPVEATGIEFSGGGVLGDCKLPNVVA